MLAYCRRKNPHTEGERVPWLMLLYLFISIFCCVDQRTLKSGAGEQNHCHRHVRHSITICPLFVLPLSFLSFLLPSSLLLLLPLAGFPLAERSRDGGPLVAVQHNCPIKNRTTFPHEITSIVTFLISSGIFLFLLLLFFLVPHPPHTERSIQAESFSFTKHTWCWTTAKQIFLLVLFVEQEQGNMQNDCIDSLKAELRTQCNRGEANKHSFSCPSFSLLSLWWLFLLLID